MTKKMSLKQPDVDLEKARTAFVEEPETKITKKRHASNYPWQQEGINERVILQFPLRLPEPLKLKLEWVVKNSLEYRSMHDLCLRAITEKIDEELKKIM